MNTTTTADETSAVTRRRWLIVFSSCYSSTRPFRMRLGLFLFVSFLCLIIQTTVYLISLHLQKYMFITSYQQRQHEDLNTTKITRRSKDFAIPVIGTRTRKNALQILAHEHDRNDQTRPVPPDEHTLGAFIHVGKTSIP